MGVCRYLYPCANNFAFYAMRSFAIGDEVAVRVSVNNDIIFDVEFSDARYRAYGIAYFKLIGKNDKHYVISCLSNVDGSIEVTEALCRRYNINNQYLNEMSYVLNFTSVGGRRFPDYYTNPIKCIICSLAVPYALPNQLDGNSFICWSCRDDTRNHYKIQKLKDRIE